MSGCKDRREVSVCNLLISVLCGRATIALYIYNSPITCILCNDLICEIIIVERDMLFVHIGGVLGKPQG